jgi:mono/diheme cytochrome c family protein
MITKFRLLLLLLVIGLLSGCGEVPAEEIREGETVYLTNCSRCHQIDGSGFARLYPNLAGNPIVILHDPDPTIEIVLNGRGGMPAFRDSLGPQELAQVISYIRTAWGNDASPVLPTQTR